MSRYSDSRIDRDNVRRAMCKWHEMYMPIYYPAIVRIKDLWERTTGNREADKLSNAAIWAVREYAASFNPEELGTDDDDESIVAVLSGKVQV